MIFSFCSGHLLLLAGVLHADVLQQNKCDATAWAQWPCSFRPPLVFNDIHKIHFRPRRGSSHFHDYFPAACPIPDVKTCSTILIIHLRGHALTQISYKCSNMIGLVGSKSSSKCECLLKWRRTALPLHSTHVAYVWPFLVYPCPIISIHSFPPSFSPQYWYGNIGIGTLLLPSDLSHRPHS